MTRLKRGSGADAGLFRYKYAKVLAGPQNDRLRSSVHQWRFSTSYGYHDVSWEELSKTRSRPECSSDSGISVQVASLPVGSSVFSDIKWVQTVSLEVEGERNDIPRKGSSTRPDALQVWSNTLFPRSQWKDWTQSMRSTSVVYFLPVDLLSTLSHSNITFIILAIFLY